jgi:hypothetical protein
LPDLLGTVADEEGDRRQEHEPDDERIDPPRCSPAEAVNQELVDRWDGSEAQGAGQSQEAECATAMADEPKGDQGAGAETDDSGAARAQQGEAGQEGDPTTGGTEQQ